MLTDHHHHPHDLPMEAQLWRTPDAPKAGGVRTHTTSARAGHQKCIAEQAEMWATPTGWEQNENPESFERRRQKNLEKGYNGNGQGTPLDQQAKMWPTVATRDHRDPNLRTYQERSQTSKGEQLPNFVAHRFSPPDRATRAGPQFWQRVRFWLRLCRQLKERLRSPYNKTRTLFKGKLNPDFTDWLMGLPPGFTSEEPGCNATAIWWSRCRRQLHSLCWPGD